MSDRYTINPYKQAMENYKKDYSEQMQYGDPTVEVENYIFEQEYEFEDENHQALQERLANGEIRIARSAEDAKNGNWVDINSLSSFSNSSSSWVDITLLLIQLYFRGLLGFCRAYHDNAVIFSAVFNQHINHSVRRNHRGNIAAFGLT